ncbi:MAG: efflux RND transporter periplasmic adaptor subunit [Methylohalobius sp. ZOD2]
MSAMFDATLEANRPHPERLPTGANFGLFYLALCALVLLPLSGCGKSEQQAAPEAPPPEVKIAQPVQREVMEWDEYPGKIEAVESVEVRARVDGYLEKVNFEAGDRVKQGDLLFVIDPRPFQAELNRAQAELEEAKARLELARSNLARAEQLLEKHFISREEYDARRAEVKQARAAVRSAEADVEVARLNLEFTQVRSPIDGVVGRELITEGNLVKGGGADATQLTFIVSIDPVYAYVAVDEKSALEYQRLAEQGVFPKGSVAMELALANEADYAYKGQIDYESPRFEVATGTQILRGVFANPARILKPGLFVRARVPASAPYQAILLPDRAIASSLAQKIVWVMDENDQVASRQVTLGPLVEGLRVIREGLKLDEWVVVEGIQKLKPGIRVKPERMTATPTEPR